MKRKKEAFFLKIPLLTIENDSSEYDKEVIAVMSNFWDNLMDESAWWNIENIRQLWVVNQFNTCIIEVSLYKSDE